MKRFSVTAISPALRKLGSLLFIFLILCGVGQQATEFTKRNSGRALCTCEQTGINQASLLASSSYLAMPRVVELTQEFRDSESSFEPLYALSADRDVASLFANPLSLWNSTDIPAQLSRYYGMLPLPNAPPVRS